MPVKKKKVRRLRNIEIEEISLVDTPAVADAVFAIVKRLHPDLLDERPDLFVEKRVVCESGQRMSLYQWASLMEGKPIDPLEFVEMATELPPLQVEQPPTLSLEKRREAVEMLEDLCEHVELRLALTLDKVNVMRKKVNSVWERSQCRR